MKTKIVMLLLIFLISCKEKKEKIEYLLHNDKAVLWGVYDDNFKSMDMSYYLKKENNECIVYDEKQYPFISFKLGLILYSKNLNDMSDVGVYNSWNVCFTGENVYLRCMLDCYIVMNHNENYFKLLTRELDTIYLVKTECQSDNCFIPKNVMPAPF